MIATCYKAFGGEILKHMSLPERTDQLEEIVSDQKIYNERQTSINEKLILSNELTKKELEHKQREDDRQWESIQALWIK